MSKPLKLISTLTIVAAISSFSIFTQAQNDDTNASLYVQNGYQTLYAGDQNLNNDICTPANIAQTNIIETVTCNSNENSIILPDIFIKANRQNPYTVMNDVIVQDLRGYQTSNYTITAEVSNFVDPNNVSAEINLGTNPDNSSGLDTGTVTSVYIPTSTQGAGYSNNVTVTISAPASGTQATGTAIITAGKITGVTMTNLGSGYTSNDVVTVSFTDNAGTPTTAAAGTAQIIATGDNLSAGTVDKINITSGGTGYTGTPTVTISAPASGTQATAVATTLGNVITSIVITNPGSGYTTSDVVTVAITGGSGTGATATPVLTRAGQPQNNIFVTLDPSIGTLKGLVPTNYSMADFAEGPRALVTNNTTQHTLFYTTQATSTGRFGLDGIEFGLRVPAFVSAGQYESTITQTVIN
jgi:hypothetical protein